MPPRQYGEILICRETNCDVVVFMNTHLCPACKRRGKIIKPQDMSTHELSTALLG